MSFSVEFWGDYDFVYNTFQSHRLGLKDLIYMFAKKYESEVEYAKGMKRIYDMNYAVTKMPSLLNGILTFKNDLYNQYEYSMEFTSNIQDEIIKPLEMFLTKQSNLGKYLNNEVRKIEKEFRASVDKLEKSRLKFHSSAKLAEDSKIQSEMGKINPNFSQEVKTRIEIKAQNFLREAKENERFYLANINLANNTREVYIETMKKMMNEFQKLEENLIDMIKDCLRKYIIYQVALLRNLQYDIEKKASVRNINFIVVANRLGNGKHKYSF